MTKDGQIYLTTTYLQQAYGLTETENAVVQSLLNNLSINEIAENRDVPLEPTR